MKKIIITADDYGMAPSVNRAIEEGIEAGVITSTNIMPNMDYAEDALDLRKRHPEVSIGIHWTLTAGRPISPDYKVKSLLGKSGVFWSYEEFRRKYRKGLIKEEEIKIELGEQYNRFSRLCGKPDYWNTHQNIHVEFKLFNLFISVAKDYGIDKMRTHQRLYVPPKDKSTLSLTFKILEPLKKMVLGNWMRRASKLNIKSPQGILLYMNEEDKFDIEFMLNNIRWKNKNIGELVIHPATDVDSPYFGSITDKRIREYKLFSNSSVRNLIFKKGFELITFKNI